MSPIATTQRRQQCRNPMPSSLHRASGWRQRNSLFASPHKAKSPGLASPGILWNPYRFQLMREGDSPFALPDSAQPHAGDSPFALENSTQWNCPGESKSPRISSADARALCARPLKRNKAPEASFKGPSEVREGGLEPPHLGHWYLKPARLPIPPLSQSAGLIPQPLARRQDPWRRVGFVDR